MFAQLVVPLTSQRVVAALGSLAPEVFSSPQGGHLAEIEGELLRVEHRPERPFALAMSAEWRRRLPVDHHARVRETIDEMNRELTPARTSLSVTDSGHLDVRVALTHWVGAGVSDGQLNGWLRRGADVLARALSRLDRTFPEPAFRTDTP
ncbi:MAG TPA: hypothetical protein VFC82_03240 [Actinomycetaceae bacterium]|nr:hypothetical protein [Actinomycetaceae bacterium]